MRLRNRDLATSMQLSTVLLAGYARLLLSFAMRRPGNSPAGWNTTSPLRSGLPGCAHSQPARRSWPGFLPLAAGIST